MSLHIEINMNWRFQNITDLQNVANKLLKIIDLHDVANVKWIYKLLTDCKNKNKVQSEQNNAWIYVSNQIDILMKYP